MPVKGNQPTLLNDIELAFNGLDKELASGKKRWEEAIKKARENRNEERLQNLLKKGPPTYKSSRWEGEIEKEHGRIESRVCTVIPIGDLPSKEGWEGIKSIARVCRERTENEKTSHETAYYIASLKPDAPVVSEVVREHWGVENGLHLRLDVVFAQDKSRYRNRVGARNLAIIYKMALNGLMREDTLKRGMATKRCEAACNPAYREKVLNKLL